MKRSKKPVLAPEEEAAAGAEEVRGRLFERPDGFYWQSLKGGEEYGPFTTRVEAEADMQSGGASAADPEALQEAESELGISEWIDPDSGLPAEDSVPHIEDH
ncbi:MAG TPA: hypothetical protein VHL85_09075 [Burkholderiales bacterium]|jgi:hypothetical protein|nr:hypothetical protein [Burkholderiales bacterium]